MLDRKIKIIAYTFSFLILFGFAGMAHAADISVTFGSGFPITENNLAPGQIIEREFTVMNNTAGNQNLMMRIDDQAGIWHFGSFDIEEKLNFQIKKPDATFSTLPNNLTSETLEDLYASDAPFVFDTLEGPVGNSKIYKILVTFDATTGNKYQSKKTVFDMSVGIDAVPAQTLSTTDDGDDDDNGDGNGDGGGDGGIVAGVSGGLTRGFFGPQTAGEEVQQQEGQEGQQPIGEGETMGVEGAETTKCQYWPLWVWIVVLLAYAAALWRYLQKNYKAEKMVWKFALTWTAAAVAFWYFGDKCREYRWFLYGSIIIAIASHFIYLWALKKKIKNRTLPVDNPQG